MAAVGAIDSEAGSNIVGNNTRRVTIATDDSMALDIAQLVAALPAVGSMYSVSFSAVAVTVAQDVFELVASAGKVLEIHKIILGQYSDFGDAAAEILSVLVMRGHTTTGSGGAAATPVPFTTGTSGATAATNNTTVATGGASTLVADVFNVAAGWYWGSQDPEFIEVAAGVRMVVRITAPADSLTMNGTIVYQERDA